MPYKNKNKTILGIAVVLTLVIFGTFSLKYFADQHSRTLSNWGCANFDQVDVSFDNPFQRALLHFGGLYVISATPTSTIIVAETFFQIPFNTIEVSCTGGGIQVL